MFCSKCGAQNRDGAKFCENCGASLFAPNKTASTTTESQQGGKWPNETQYNGGSSYSGTASYGSAPQYGGGIPYNTTASNNAAPYTVQGTLYSGRPSLYSLGSSPLMLLAAIALTVALVLSFITGTYTNSYAAVFDAFGELGIDYDYDVIRAYSSPAVRLLSAISSSILPALYCLAVWLIYANCKKQKNGTAGLTIIKILAIISIIGAALLGGIILILGIVIMLAGSAVSYSGYGEFADFLGVGAAVGGSALIILSAAAVVLVIIYYAKLISTVNTVKYTLTTGNPKLSGISGFVGAFCYIAAGAFTLSVIAAIANAFSGVSLATLIGIAFSVAEAVSSVCFGMLIFKYRREMKGLMAK